MISMTEHAPTKRMLPGFEDIPERAQLFANKELVACAADLLAHWNLGCVPAGGALNTLLDLIGDDNARDAEECLVRASALIGVLSTHAVADTRLDVGRWRPIAEAPKNGEPLITDDNTSDGASFAVCGWHENPQWRGFIYDDDLMNDARPEGPAPSVYLDIPTLPPKRPEPHYGEHLREIDTASTGQ